MARASASPGERSSTVRTPATSPFGAGDGGDEQGVGDVPGALGDVPGEARIGRRSIDRQRRSGDGDVAGDAPAHRQLRPHDRVRAGTRRAEVAQHLAVQCGDRDGGRAEGEAGGRAQRAELVGHRSGDERRLEVNGQAGQLADQIRSSHARQRSDRSAVLVVVERPEVDVPFNVVVTVRRRSADATFSFVGVRREQVTFDVLVVRIPFNLIVEFHCSLLASGSVDAEQSVPSTIGDFVVRFRHHQHTTNVSTVIRNVTNDEVAYLRNAPRAAPATYSEPAARTASSPSARRKAWAQAAATVSWANTSSQPSAKAALAITPASIARGDGAVHVDDHVELVGAQRLEHRLRLAERADDENSPTLGIEVAEEHLSARVRTGRVVGSVDDHQGLVLEHLETAVELHGGEALGDDLGVQRRGEERLDRGQGDRRIVALVGAVQRHERLRVDRRRGAQIDEPPAEGELVVGDVEVLAAVQPGGGVLGGQHGDEFGVGGADQGARCAA